MASLIQDSLAEHRYAGPADDLPVSFSVDVAFGPDRLHRLQWGRCTVLRTPDARRLVDGLLRHLQVALAPPAGVVRVRMPSVVTDRGLVLMPDRLRRNLALLDRRLTGAGLAPTDSAVVDLDLASRRAQVPGPITVDRRALDAAAAALPRRRDDAGAPVRGHEVEAVLADPSATGTFERLAWLRGQIVAGCPVSLDELRMLDEWLPLVPAALERPADLATVLLPRT